MDSAGIPWYSTGTVNVTQGSSNVAGVGTNWVNAGLKVGDIFTIDKSRLYQITAINSNTSLSLQEAYQGATGSSQVYFVIRNFAGTMQAQIAAQVSELVNKYESYIDTELKQITGPAGPTSFPYRGTWVTGRTYNGLDVVQYGKQLYMSLYGHTSTSANAPGATGTAWTQLTFDAAFTATESAISAIANAGAKNILPSTEPRTQIINGITFQTDGEIISVSGTAINDAVFPVITFSPPTGKQYILSGCPAGGSGSSYLLFSRPGTSLTPRFNDVGEGVSINFGNSNYLFGILVYGGTTVNNLIFRPMLRDAALKDGTYVPFGKTNSELTKLSKDISDTGWVESGSTVLPSLYRKKNGIVYIINTNVTQSDIQANIYNQIFKLPADCAPSNAIYFTSALADLTVMYFGRITTNGAVEIRPNTNISSGSSIALNVSFPV